MPLTFLKGGLEFGAFLHVYKAPGAWLEASPHTFTGTEQLKLAADYRGSFEHRKCALTFRMLARTPVALLPFIEPL